MGAERDIRYDGIEAFDRYYSIYRGYIADRKDPEQLGRVKLFVPQLYGTQVHDYWAMPKGIYSGVGSGAPYIPERGSLVWVEFEGGDVRYPVWSYGEFKKSTVTAQIYDPNGEPVKTVVKTPYPYSIIADKIHLGSLEAKEPAVLGDTLKKLLNDFLKGVTELTVNTAMGPSSVPVNIATFTQLIQELEKILSEKVNLD